MNTAIPSAEGRTILYHRRHARQKAAKTFGHFGPAVVLLVGMGPVLPRREAFTPLLGLEVVVGAAYLVLMARELLHLRHNPHHSEPVAWLELAAAFPSPACTRGPRTATNCWRTSPSSSSPRLRKRVEMGFGQL